MKLLNNLFDMAKYRKLRSLEYRRWAGILAYTTIYFGIDAFARANNIAFAIWDTVLTGTIILLVVLFGNFFCGYACFMQRFQDLLGAVGRFVLRGRYSNLISQKLRNRVKWLRYILLGVSLIVPVALRDYSVFVQLWGWFFMAGMLFSLVERRAYCKYFCFIGGLIKIAAIKRRVVLVRDAGVCTDCGICSAVCPQDCEPAKKDTPITADLWCTSCDRCLTVCPVHAIRAEKLAGSFDRG